MFNYFCVACGGALGSVARFWCSGVLVRYFGETFPIGTLVVNVTGSFLIGFLAAFTIAEGHWLTGPAGRNLFMAGFCGGYTTFSALSLQTLQLTHKGQWLAAGGNVILNIVLCLVAVWLGHSAATLFGPDKLN